MTCSTQRDDLFAELKEALHAESSTCALSKAHSAPRSAGKHNQTRVAVYRLIPEFVNKFYFECGSVRPES